MKKFNKYVKIVSIIAVFTLCASYVPSISFAASSKGTVTSNGVNLREKASTGSKIIKKLNNGTKITVHSTYKGWCYVTADGRSGFISAEYVKTSSSSSSDSSDSSSSSSSGGDGTVTASGVNLRKSANTSGTVLKKLSKGTSIEIYSKSNGWYYVKAGGTKGYISGSYVKVSSSYSSSGDEDATVDKITTHTTLKMGMRGDAVMQMQKALKSKGYFKGSATGYYGSATRDSVKSYQKKVGYKADGIAGTKTLNKLFSNSSGPNADGSTPKPTSTPSGESVKPTETENKAPAAPPKNGNVELLDWFKGGNELFKKYTVYKVIDVRTSISYNVRRFGGWYHADIEPVTKDDTAKMLESFGGAWSAGKRRPLWIFIGDRIIAGSIMGTPHGVDTLPNNGMKGQVCIHLLNSKIHENNKVDSGHQAAIKEAYNAGKKAPDPNATESPTTTPSAAQTAAPSATPAATPAATPTSAPTVPAASSTPVG